MAVSRARINLELAALGVDPSTIQNDSVANQRAVYLLRNHDTVTGALGTQTLTSDATNNSDAETVTIGSVVYTWKTTLTGVRATSTLTSDNTNVADGDTVTLDGKLYTFRTAVAKEGDVLIGANADASLLNLIRAINHSGTAGTDYICQTVHPTVSAATSVTSHAFVVTATKPGTAPNSYGTIETSAHLSWTGTTLSGGVAPVAYEVLIGADAATSLANLKKAINASGTSDTEYSSGTAIHPLVTAGTITATTLVVSSRYKAITNSIVTTETGAHTSWGAATLASGLPGMVAVPAGDAQTVTAGQPV